MGPARRRADAQGRAARAQGVRDEGLVLRGSGVARRRRVRRAGGEGAVDRARRPASRVRSRVPHGGDGRSARGGPGVPRRRTRRGSARRRSLAGARARRQRSTRCSRARCRPSERPLATAPLAWRTGDVDDDRPGPRERRRARAVRERARGGARCETRPSDAATRRRPRSARAASGCVREAVVLGPTTWAPITGVEEPGPLDRADAPPRGGVPDAATRSARRLGRWSWSAREGAQSAAVGRERAPGGPRGRGGPRRSARRDRRPGASRARRGRRCMRAARSSHDVRSSWATGRRRASPASAPARARSRVVARVGTARDDDTVEIDAFGDDGAPLRAHAPAVGSVATSTARRRAARGHHGAPRHRRDSARRCGGARHRTIRARPRRCSGPWPADRAQLPELALVYARAVDARARPLRRHARRARAQRVRAGPRGVAHELGGRPSPTPFSPACARGRDEAGVEILRDLGRAAGAVRRRAAARRGRVRGLHRAGRDRLFDRARAALDRARGAARRARRSSPTRSSRARPATGAELVAATCDPTRLTPRDTSRASTPCTPRGTARARRWSSRGFARCSAAALDPARRRAARRAGRRATTPPPAARSARCCPPSARSPPSTPSIARPDVALARAARRARRPRLAGRAHAAAPRGRRRSRSASSTRPPSASRREDRAKPMLPNAATAVLAHTERYDVQPDGPAALAALRRPPRERDDRRRGERAGLGARRLGSRQRARPAAAHPQAATGASSSPTARPAPRRRTPISPSSSRATWSRPSTRAGPSPSDTGDLGIDTPDLLPDRTAVHDATIELRLPRACTAPLWSHRSSARSTERADGDARVLTWHLADHPARRVEDGVPTMDRSARRELLDRRVVRRRARAARDAGGARRPRPGDRRVGSRGRRPAAEAGHPTRATVEAVVVAAGKALRESDAGALSDYSRRRRPRSRRRRRARPRSRPTTGAARWLIVRALRELGIPCDLVVAESDAVQRRSRVPSPLRALHPPARGRPRRSAQRRSGSTPTSSGPPLPAGRISPELRGRLALCDRRARSRPCPPPADPRRVGDEIDVRLALDAHGDARGTFAVVLRGRDAQGLAESLVTTVGVERQSALRDVVLAWLPWANVDAGAARVVRGKLAGEPARRRERSAATRSSRARKTWLLPGLDTMHGRVPARACRASGPRSRAAAGRESALALNRSVQYHVHRRVELPAGATRRADARPARGEGPAGRRLAPLRGQASGPGSQRRPGARGRLHPRRRRPAPSPPSEYDAFVAVAHAADDGFLASTRIAMP